MSVISKNTLRLIGSAQYVTKIPQFNSQYSRSICHIASQLKDQNSIKLIKSCNLCRCGCGKFQHTQAGKESSKKIINDLEAEKKRKDIELWLSKFKFETIFYKYGVRCEFQIPSGSGSFFLELVPHFHSTGKGVNQ
ncbi:hypothetical protein HCN44_010085 [Aphidius gifuensis]|uniref:Uncharacterized protein n=1 Tax=Aphidius gifuensis TaxID=684658 RepID=A0A834XWG2_APHGI|nr:uncharacterized protein LOC122851674 [Aphidius gifuensis]KAF7993490.1 hypothetical protein HCN44_010085 [Aphidius gifuensis]